MDGRRRGCLGWGLSALATPLGAAAAAAASAGVEEGAPRVPLFIGQTSNRPVWHGVLDLLARTAGLRWDLQVLPWARAQAMALRGEGLIFAMDRTQAREAQYRFTRSLVDTHVWVAVRRGEPLAVQGPEDLRAQRVCVARGARYGDAFEGQRPRMRELMESSGGPDAQVRMLRAGRCEAALLTARGADAAAAQRVLEHVGVDLAGIELLPAPVHHGGVYLAAALGSRWLDWLPRLDAAIQQHRHEIDTRLRAETQTLVP